MTLRKPGIFFRGLILGAQGIIFLLHLFQFTLNNHGQGFSITCSVSILFEWFDSRHLTFFQSSPICCHLKRAIDSWVTWKRRLFIPSGSLKMGSQLLISNIISALVVLRRSKAGVYLNGNHPCSWPFLHAISEIIHNIQEGQACPRDRQRLLAIRSERDPIGRDICCQI